MSSSRTAFVLSGGASLGAIQVGMLRALIDEGTRPDLIVGTSVGAVNGAFLASRAPVPATIDELADVWLRMSRGQVFPIEPLTGLLGVLGARRNLVPALALRRLVSRHARGERLEDLPIPLHVIACDVLTGAEVRLSEGPLVEAVMASAAIPGVLPPVDWQGRLLMDGGIVDNTPISHALALGADTVYVLPTGGPCALLEAPRGAMGMLVHAVGLMVSRRFTGEALDFAGRANVTILPPPCPITVQPMDFGHAATLIAAAEASARAFLAGAPQRLVPRRPATPVPPRPPRSRAGSASPTPARASRGPARTG